MALKDYLPAYTPISHARGFTINGRQVHDGVSRFWNERQQASTGAISSATRRIDNRNGAIIAWLDYSPDRGWTYMLGEGGARGYSASDRALQRYIIRQIERRT